MSIRVTSYIWQHPQEYPMGGGSLLVLLAIADNADDTGQAWPALPTIARKARLSERQVVNVVRQLETAGMIRVERGCGRGHVNRYTLVMRGADTEKGEADFTDNISPLRGKGEIWDREKVKSATEKVKFPAEKVKPISPEPSVEPSREPSGESSGVARARARGSTATRLPAEFAMSPELRAWARERAPAVDLDIEHERFCNYWWGSGKTKRDWPATWRTWMLGEQSRANQRHPAARAGPAGNGHRTTTSEHNWALYEEIKRQEEADDEAERVPGAIDAAFRSHE